VRVAVELGYLTIPPDLLVEPQAAAKLYDNEVLAISTGAQGEPTSALSRIANNDNRNWTAKPGDTYILSATPIPGNETSVGRVINNLFLKGAEVVYGSAAQVHVSGHASQEEHKLMLSLLRPQYVVPIHGERRHLVTYKKLAQTVGIPADNIHLVDNGYVIELNAEECNVTGRVPSGNVFVDGVTVGEVGHVVIRDRQLLARDGVLLVVVTVDKNNGQLVAGPDIVTRGFVYAAESTQLIEDTKERIKAVLYQKEGQLPDWSYLNKKIRDTAGQFLYEQTRRRPMVLPVVVEI